MPTRRMMTAPSNLSVLRCERTDSSRWSSESGMTLYEGTPPGMRDASLSSTMRRMPASFVMNTANECVNGYGGVPGCFHVATSCVELEQALRRPVAATSSAMVRDIDSSSVNICCGALIQIELRLGSVPGRAGRAHVDLSRMGPQS